MALATSALQSGSGFPRVGEGDVGMGGAPLDVSVTLSPPLSPPSYPILHTGRFLARQRARQPPVGTARVREALRMN